MRHGAAKEGRTAPSPAARDDTRGLEGGGAVILVLHDAAKENAPIVAVGAFRCHELSLHHATTH